MQPLARKDARPRARWPGGAIAALACALAPLAAAAPNPSVLAAAQACEPDARALLERLVRIDSGTNDLAGLRTMSAAVRSALEPFVATVESAPSTVPGLADSLVATVTGSGRGRVLLIAHMDTVFPAGTAAQRPYRVTDGRGIGPGAGDDKSGIVAAVCALRILKELPFRDFARITLVVNSNEETGSFGSRELIRLKAAESDIALNLERGVPPDGVIVARKGAGTITIDIVGRAAHAGLEPEKGRNAIVEAAHQITQIGSLADPAKETTVNVTTVQGGTAMNVIPDHAIIKADVRAFTAAEFDRVERELQRLSRATTVPDVQVSASLARNFPAWPRAPSTDTLLARARKLYGELDRTLSAVVVGGSADSAFSAEAGTPTIDGFGLLGAGAHGPDDHADLDSIVPRTYLLVRMLMDAGSNPP